MGDFLERRSVQYTWLALVLVWGVIRTLVIWALFKKYGVNPWIYLVIDLGASIPYAKYSARMAIDFIRNDGARLWRSIAITALTFYLPDLYVLTFANHVPADLLVGFIISMGIFSVISLTQIVRSNKNPASKDSPEKK